MSYDATTWAWRADVRGTKKIVLLYLADLADEDGLCFPGSVRMTERCGVGRSAVFDALTQSKKQRRPSLLSMSRWTSGGTTCRP
jgi:hypothetical protein